MICGGYSISVMMGFLRISVLLVFFAATLVFAAPYEKRWGPGSWNGGGGWSGPGSWPKSGGSLPSSRGPPSNGHWPFSGNYGGWNERSNPPSASSTPTTTLQKKSYLNYEEKAQSTGSCDLQNAVNYMQLSSGESNILHRIAEQILTSKQSAQLSHHLMD